MLIPARLPSAHTGGQEAARGEVQDWEEQVSFVGWQLFVCFAKAGECKFCRICCTPLMTAIRC